MAYIDLILIFCTALGFSVISVPLLVRFANSKQIYDLPDCTTPQSRRMHIKPTPRLGGIAIVSAFFFALMMWKIPIESKILYSGSLILFLVGLFDDLKTLSARIRLVIQIVVSCLTVFYANLSLKSLILSPSIILPMPPWLGFCLAVFIIIGAINAMNMIDGLDGLASGVLLISMSIFSYFIFLNLRTSELLLSLTVPLLGSILGFLKYNTHPSSIFMGDSGSNWLGFMVGTFILRISNEIPTLPITSLLLAFSVPIFDTAHVIFLRLMEGKNPMTADNRHFHHSLIKIGFTHSQSVGIIYFLMFFFGLLGMIPVAFPMYSLWWVSWFGISLLLFILSISVRLEKNFLHRILASKFGVYKRKVLTPVLSRILFVLASLHRYTIYVLLFSTPFLMFVHPSWIGTVFAFFCLLMCIRIFINKSCSFFEAFLSVVLIAILFSIGSVTQITIEIFSLRIKLHTLYNCIFLWLLCSTIMILTFTLRRKIFVITPTDVLLVLIPLLILMIPDTWAHEYGLRIMCMRSLILFAGLRVVEKIK